MGASMVQQQRFSNGWLRGYPLRWAFSNFYQFGPSIGYSSSLSANVPPAIVGARPGYRYGNDKVTYAGLIMSDDGEGHYRSYLANEENFVFLKDLESRNF